MIRSIIQQPNPKLDLLFERIVDVSRESIWTAWTTPEQLKKWFAPVPWETVDCEQKMPSHDEPWKVEDRGEKPAIALKGR